MANRKKQPPPGPQYVGIVDAAEMLGCSTKTLRRAIADGRLKAYRLGGNQTIRLKIEDVHGFLTPAGPGDAA